MFLLNEVCTNKLALYSELIIFIRYENNSYNFIYAKEHKLYVKLYILLIFCEIPYSSQERGFSTKI